MAATASQKTGPLFGVNFDGGGADGFANSVYMNVGIASGVKAPYTLTAPLVMTVNVVGLSTKATAERSFGAGSSYGTLTRGSYNAATFTTTLTWTIPTGTVIPALGTSTDAPDILFSFRDGLSGKGRITNKIVLARITGGTVIAPSSTPVDSSVVKDVDQGAVSPNGIY